MKLYQQLQLAKTEEDVKDAYIKAIGLKSYSKNLIDIQTKEIWFEAKDSYRHSTYRMFTQLLHYVQQALNKGEEIPPFLCVIDTHKAAVMKTTDALPLLNDKKHPIKWGKNASGYTEEALDAVSAYIGTYIVSFRIETHEEEFISTIKNAIKSGDIIRTQITPNNLKQVFDKWVQMIGQEIIGVEPENYSLLFFADIMNDGNVSTHENLPAALLFKNNSPVFNLGNKLYELGSKEGYRQFWAIYHRPPKKEYRDYLLERRDILIPLDERIYKGGFYTPFSVVDKSYDKLSEILGENWQKEYVVWDMCCGVGNLEVKHSNPRNIYMSTLDAADVDIMKSTKTCVSANRFQYDYLNDDITEDGQIDYSITNKVPESLQNVIKEGKKILILMNPPYAEATNADNKGDGSEKGNKAGVAKTKFGPFTKMKYGKASNELYTQFVARIAKEMPTATIAMFSTLKYVISPTLEEFRKNWFATYLGGFVVHSKAFEGLKGDFPIGFLVWKTDNRGHVSKSMENQIVVDVLDKNANPIGEKIILNSTSFPLLTNWISRPKSNKVRSIPLKNAIAPATSKKDLRGLFWSDGAIGYVYCGGNDLQHAIQQTSIFSSTYGSGHGFFVNPSNLWQVAIVFSVRRLSKPTWLNDRDQFFQPNTILAEEFKVDCLVWMLFNGSNLTAGANELAWEGETWNIVNHFIPYTEDEVGSPERFESDFMVQYLQDKALSNEATQVLNEGKKLWRAYFLHTDMRSVREELKLNRADVGWYQIRKALQARNNSGDYIPVNFDDFDEAYLLLTEKLRPLVYKFGFLKG